MGRVRLAPTMTLPDVVDEAVRAAGGAWLAADGERAPLRELVDRADALAARLGAAGLVPGDPLGLLLPNGLRYAEAFLAAVRLGAVIVPLDEALPERGLDDAARTVPLAATLAEHPRPVRGSLAVTATGGGWHVPGQPDSAGAAAAPRPRRSDPAAVFFTSGTTGEPKPITLTHHQLVRPLIALQQLHASFFAGSPAEQVKRLTTVVRRHGTRLLGAAGRQTWLCTTPFRAMAGHQVFTGALLLGHNLVTSSAFHPRRTLELVDAHRVNVLAGTPAVLEVLLRVGDLSPYDLSSLLVIGVGGGPAAPGLVDRAGRRFGCTVTVGYGSTELGGGVLATRLQDSPQSRQHTVGHPFPGSDVRILDEYGAEMPPGRPGELVCRTDGQPDWLHTGDLALRDDDGTVTILGRKDDLVIRGGANIHPNEIERVVDEFPAVARSAAVGVPSHHDQQLWLFVVPAGGYDPSPEAVRAECRDVLAPGKQPDRVRVVDELPMTEHGEVCRHLLREQAGDHAGKETAQS
ncbi:class I adenylate-forming enzyme family protein [Haloactinomyces albus]|uniref:Acyl-CoA synthetase (AMP-forming)/AMP-acid ligase II n=1 Tax=Haloactinomyces albus TaxID=1352928 RepID=A0AAE3ZAG5_9ACTN|nr:class I adenylate-forming enzyme family protein [Haloactinomyces albus]MDR7299899.1 acyl-CoA synthetase (AMP-forming)/AMP-acid ligase II [Haloactinomyces albus]